MSTATPQDTFDHMLGSGAFSWEWWQAVKLAGTTPDGGATDAWTAEITAENGDGGTTIRTIGHQAVMEAARAVLASPPQYASTLLARECSHLLYDAGETDFDAALADELLQFMVLGEIVYG